MPKLAEKKKYSHHLRSFIDFFDIHNPFKVPVNKLINIAAGVTVSNDINEDSAVVIGTKLACMYAFFFFFFRFGLHVFRFGLQICSLINN